MFGASFLLVLGLFLWIFLAFWPALMAKNKGYSFWAILILSWFVSFVATLILVLILPNRNETAQDRADDRAAEQALEREEGEA